jgi:hypothetical protein
MRWTCSLLVLGFLASCGSHPPPATSAPTAADSSGAAASTAPDSSSAAPGASAASPGGDGSKPSIESQREPFMRGCMKKVQAPDYCECGFQQFREVFKDADLSQDAPDGDPRFKTLKERTVTACASKLPEDTVKGGFLTGCSGGDARKTPYCQCAWTSLRKGLSLVDFLSDFEGQRFDDAKTTMVAACKGKFPDAVAKTEFLGACTKNNPAGATTCACIWKSLRAKYSTEQIAAGMADVKSTPGVDKCSAQ